MLDTGLRGRVALVTGGNHGIGAATAKALAAQGVRVFITYLRMEPDTSREHDLGDEDAAPGRELYASMQAQSAEAVLEAIHSAGGEAAAWEADLSKPDTIPELFDRAEAAFGPVEVLVNNAAHCLADTFISQSRLDTDSRQHTVYQVRTITSESHDRHFAVNSRGTALMMAEYARRHVERGASWGRIINLSTDGSPGFAGEISYGASKYAVESYSRAAAKELGQYGITVNIVSPGPTQTGWIDPELEEICKANTPLGRLGQPEDLADTIVLLASEQARWITGQILYTGGGHRMT